MNQEAYDLRARLREAQERETELERKVEETRVLLGKADERRARDRDRPERWNHIINNLEDSYRMLKQEAERARIVALQVDRELSSILDGSGMSLTSLDAEIAAVTGATAVPEDFDQEALGEPDEEYSIVEEQLGWRDLLHMALEDLATLTAREIAQVRACLAPGRSPRMTDADRRLIEGRLQLAAELRASASPTEIETLEQGEQRRQIILRAAIDKIQHNRAHQMTDEEVRAIIWCQQRLAAKPQASTSEKRLLRIMDASISLIRRTRRQGR